MLPYFDEYCNTEKNSYNEVYAFRLRKLNRVEENVLEMSAEKISDVINAKDLKLATLNAFYSAFQDYLRWVNKTYGVSISDCYYELGKLRDLASESCIENLTETLFSSFSDLKNTLVKEENEYLSIQELELSEKKYENLCLNQKKFNAYTVLAWNGLSSEDMLALKLNEVLAIITSGDIVVNGKAHKISDDEIDFLKDTYYSIIDIQENDKKEFTKKSNYKSKKTAWTYDNLFNTQSQKTLINLSYCALGKVLDTRLDKTAIKKAGIFNRMYQYEKDNDFSFFGNDGCNAYMQLFNVSLSKAQRIVNEYNKFRKSIEKAEMNVEK